jgi:hypothetical protein
LIDKADAAALLRLNRSALDIAYVLKWVKQFALEAELAQIWGEASPGEPPPSNS